MLRAVLWVRRGFAESTLACVGVGKVLSFLLGGAGLVLESWLLVGLGIVGYVACEQERLLLGARPEPGGWEPPPSEPEAAAAPGWFERRRLARRDREARERVEREARLRVRVDAILEKLNRVGMQGLAAEELAVLKEASDVFKHSRR